MNAADYAAHREKLGRALLPGSLAVLHANDLMPTNADGTMRFRQNNDLYWLTGIVQEQTALILFPQHPDPQWRTVLFIMQADESFVKWNGRRLTREEASAISGVEHVLWQHQFDQVFYQLAVYAEHIYLNSIEHPRAVNEVPTRDDRFAEQCRQKFRLHSYKRLAPLLGRLRMVKSEAELALLQKACDITGKGFRRLLRFVRPGVRERQVQAELIHEYLQHDGDWADYQPILASGADSCILHYTSNGKTCRAGDVLLADAAASYKYYNADLTRVVPVGGRFSPRQKQVYNAVHQVHEAIKSFIRPGHRLDNINQFARERLLEQLQALRLCTAQDIAVHGGAVYLDTYCYHFFGHLLGLDVHDVGNRYEPLPENAVLTVEPGIYIPEEGLGVRLENNVQVRANGVHDLMADIPLASEEIEYIMNSDNFTV